MNKRPNIAVLGAGIMGASTALNLSRQGCDVTLYDQADKPFSGASRWNEGKIHLGYLYNADPSLNSARHVLSGGLLFRPSVEALLGESIAPAITPHNDIYLCHADSVVGEAEMAGYFDRVSGLIQQHEHANRYLVDISNPRFEKLTPGQLRGITASPEIVAGFSVPERSVSTNWIADRYVKVLEEEPAIQLSMRNRVTGIKQDPSRQRRSWRVASALATDDRYDVVINTLWEGRMAIDEQVGVAMPSIWSHRYRQSVFITTTKSHNVPSAIIATGPFGDVKNYDGRHYYISWYPYGLRTESHEISPPDPAPYEVKDIAAFTNQVLDKLETFIPAMSAIRQSIASVNVQGGWVYAAAKGALHDRASSLHARKDFGIEQYGSYFSVDTGKYSTAPALAKVLSERVLDATG